VIEIAAHTIETYPKFRFSENAATTSENIPNDGNDENIDFGMSPHPNQIHVHHRIPAKAGTEKMHAKESGRAREARLLR
jgi:hypothetical protein